MLRSINIVFSEKIQFDDTVLYIKPFEGIRTIYCSNMVIYHYMLGREGQSVGNMDERKMQFRKQEFLKLCDEYSLIRNQLSSPQRTYFDVTINRQIFQEFYVCSLRLTNEQCIRLVHEWDRKIQRYDFVNNRYIPIKRKLLNADIKYIKILFDMKQLLKRVICIK